MKRILFSLMACLLSLVATAQVILVTSAPPAGASYLTLDENANALQFPVEGGTKTVGVVTNLNYSTTVSNDWCTVVKTETGMTVTAAPSTLEEPRTATLDIIARDGHSTRLTVSQLGTASGILVDRAEVNLENNATDFTLTVTTSTDVTLTLPEWITTTTEPARGVVTYAFTAESLTEEGTSRSDEIVFADKNGVAGTVRVKVTQSFQGFPRFAVMSDVHFGNSKGDGPKVKVPRTLQNVQKRCPNLDAIFICGDLTDWGKADQYTQFKEVFDDRTVVPENLPVYVMMGNHDNYDGNAANNYKVLNQPLHRLIDIKGYPFITTSMNGGGWDDYAQEELVALGENLAEAAKRYPGKPIFVFTHVPPMNTVYGTCEGEGGWGSNVLTPYLKKYPQIVIFGGHSHFPLGDPRSIHQGDFTTVNDGSVTYSEVEPGVVNEGIHPAQYDYVTEACIVTLDADTTVEIQRWDTYGDEEILPRWQVKAPHDGSQFVYTKNRTGLPAPVWADGSAVEVSDVANQTCTVTFPQAQDDENIHHYVIEIVSDGNVVAKHSQFSYYYLNSRMPQTLKVKVEGLPDGMTMKARVIAYDSYKNTSEALESAEFSTEKYTPDPSVKKPVADLFDLSFSADGTAKDLSANNKEVKMGSTKPTVSFNEIYNRNAASFPGNVSCYYRVDYEGDAAMTSAFTNGFTYEVLYRPNNTSNVCPLSAQESGGAGIEQASGGLIQFFCHVGGGYKTLKSSVTAEAGKYYHVVAAYDKTAGKTRMFINGNPAGEMAVSGNFGFPSNEAARWVAVGGDCNGGANAQFALNGEVVVARMYTGALTRDEAYLLYEDAKSGNYVPDPSVEKPVADLFDVQFNEDGTANDVSENALEVKTGDVVNTVAYDETLRRNVVSFNGTNQSYYRIDYAENEKVMTALTNGFAIETMYCPEGKISNVCPLSSQESGGAGIEQAGDGTIQFYCRVGGSYAIAKSTVKAVVGKFYHVVAVYDKDNERAKIYVDGQPAGDVPAVGVFGMAKEGAQWFCIGGDAHPTYPSQFNLNGKVAMARMYAHVLNRDEVQLLWEDAKAVEAPEPSVEAPVADLFDVAFATDGTATDVSENGVEVKVGATKPVVTLDETLGRNVAAFDGTTDCYYRFDYDDNEKITNALSTAFSLELMYSSDKIGGNNAFSSQEGGGVGFEQTSSGALELWFHVGGKYVTLKTGITITPGEYYHLTATYDKAAGQLKYYVNGELKAEQAVSGDFGFPKAGAHWFGIGTDAHPTNVSQNRLTGKVAIARIFGRAVNAGEVSALYDAATKK